MKILIDGDGCPVVKICENIAKKYKLECVIFCDTAHIFKSDYSTIITVSKGADSADFKLINSANNGDIIVTQDYGVASMGLAKGCNGIHQNGHIYTDENILGLLSVRHVNKVSRKQNKGHIKGPKKRTPQDDVAFKESLENLVQKYYKSMDNDAPDGV